MKQLPIDLHEDTLPENSPARLTLLAAREAFDLVHRAHRVLGDTPEFAEKAVPAVEKTLARIDDGMAALAERDSKLQSNINSTLAPPANDLAVPYIVAYLQKQKSPAATVIKAVANDDKRIASVALALPAVVLGLTDEEYTTVREQAAEKFATKLWAEVQENNQAREKLQRAGEIFTKEMSEVCRAAVQKQKMLETL